MQYDLNPEQRRCLAELELSKARAEVAKWGFVLEGGIKETTAATVADEVTSAKETVAKRVHGGGRQKTDAVCGDCGSPKIHAKGLCKACYKKGWDVRKRAKMQSPDAPRCKVDGCENVVNAARGLCRYHYDIELKAAKEKLAEIQAREVKA